MNAPPDETFFRRAALPPRTPRPTYAGNVAIKRSIAAARKAGIDVAGVEVLPDGTIRLLDARLAPRPADDLFDKYDKAGKL